MSQNNVPKQRPKRHENLFLSNVFSFFRYDCIAIADFQMGAMENWGLVTFRETAVLVDPKNTSAKTKQWVSRC